MFNDTTAAAGTDVSRIVIVKWEIIRGYETQNNITNTALVVQDSEDQFWYRPLTGSSTYWHEIEKGPWKNNHD